MFAQVADTFTGPPIDYWALVPQFILLGAALVLLLVRALLPVALPDWVPTATSVGAGIATGVVAWFLWLDVRDDGPRSVIGDAFGVDGFSLFFTMLVAAAVVLTALLADGYLTRNHMMAPEFHALLLSAATGAVVMSSANDLIVVFLSLEALSIGLYVLAAMQLMRIRSLEAAIKYFVLGAFSSAFFLYGIALVYGATGTTNLVAIRQFLTTTPLLPDSEILLIGFALLLVGLGFKVAAAPFHVWAPDVYQGAPSPVSGYMASVAKAAGFAALIRIFVVAFQGYAVDWSPLVGVLAVLTLIAGTVTAVVQTDVKRMLAYSSIAHAGYVLVAVQTASADGTSAALFYLFTYTVMVIGSFGVVTVVGGRDIEGTHPLGRYRGLSRTRPLLAFAFTVFLLAQAGVPFTSGFIGKFVVIGAAVDDASYVLAAIAMVAAVVGAFVYLRIVLNMYATDDDVETPTLPTAPPRARWPSQLALAAAFAFTVVIGVLPQFFIEFSRDAIPVLVAGG
jgi:NADH-quinone oxidoreductase subunit N